MKSETILSTSRASERNRGLDLLRVLSTLAIFAWHYHKIDGKSAFGYLGGIGWITVDLFFVHSGYLICNSLMKAKMRGEPQSVASFYTGRIFKIFPSYLTVVALYFLIPWIREYPEIPDLWKFLTFTLNFDLGISALCHLWTLSIEAQFYLILPALLALFFRRPRPAYVWTALVFLFVAGMAARGWIWTAQIESVNGPVRPVYLKWIYFPTVTRMDGLIFGVALAFAKNLHPRAWSFLTSRANLFLIVGLACLCVTIPVARRINEFVPTLVGYPMMAMTYAFLTIACLGPDSWLNRIRIPGLETMAFMTYAIYLTHRATSQIAINFFAGYGIHSFDPVTVVSACALTLVVSWLLFRFVEVPFLRLVSK